MKRKSIAAGLLAVVMAVSLAGCSGDGASKQKAADLVIKNGLVYTADGKGTTAEAVAVKGEEIVYVGDEAGAEAFTGEDTQTVDMEGGMALPGFIDSHQHPSGTINELFNLSLLDCETDEDYLEAIKTYVEENPDLASIVGAGWDRPKFKKVKQTKETLDAIEAERPVVLSDSGYHVKWLNSKALEIMGITKGSEIPDGAMVEKDKNGEPTGVVSDYPGISDKFSEFTTEQYKEALLAYQKKGLARGLTTSFEDASREFDKVVKAYQELEAENQLKYRTSCYMRINKDMEPDEAVSRLKKYRDENQDGLFRVDGAKIFIDGVLEGETAYMEEAYVNNPENYGEYFWKGKTKQLQEVCKKLEAEDLNYHFHAIGDKAVSTALDAIEYAKKGAENSKTRPAITHLQIVKPEDIKRFSELGVCAVIQAFWAGYDEYYDMAVDYVGKERADMQYPIESLFKKGVCVASASDYPVQTDRPLDAIEMGITRCYPGEDENAKSLPKDVEKSTLEEMLQSYTLNGAIANFLEDEIGSLEVGKKADLVILDKNLFDIPLNEIAKTKEMMTIFNGEIVYEQ